MRQQANLIIKVISNGRPKRRKANPKNIKEIYKTPIPVMI
jgi:hypothetical protein